MRIEFFVVIAFLLVVCFMTIQYSFLVPPKKGLPVLMYHKIIEKGADGLTVTADQLDLQLMYLKEKGYQNPEKPVKGGGPASKKSYNPDV